MNPVIYSETHLTTYTAGAAQISIPISNIVSQTSLTAENFNIQYVILNETPIASGLTLGELTEIGSKVYLPVFIKASQTGSDLLTWEKITGIKTLSFVVTANIGTIEI
jgi:hypothetical protein